MHVVCAHFGTSTESMLGKQKYTAIILGSELFQNAIHLPYSLTCTVSTIMHVYTCAVFTQVYSTAMDDSALVFGAWLTDSASQEKSHVLEC